MEKIVISLTSYPARILNVYQVIESLWNQTEPADEIILWLEEEEFPGKNDDLPSNLRDMIGHKGFRVEWITGNLKSHKKYFYALQNYSDSIVITVDDDMYYDKCMVHTLIESYRVHPNAISARNVHIIFREEMNLSPYLKWYGDAKEYIGVERMDLCAIGVGGILYPPRCGHSRWFDEKCIKELAENQDDLWLKFNQVSDNIPVVFTGMQGQKDEEIKESQVTALHLQNATGGANDRSIKQIIQWLQVNQEDIYQKWFNSLMFRVEYLIAKEQYYRDKLKDYFDVHKENNIYIFGAGKFAKIVYEFIKEYYGKHVVKAFVVSDMNQNALEIDGIPVKQLVELDPSGDSAFICGISERYKDEVKANIQKWNEAFEWMDMDIQSIRLLYALKKDVAENNKHTWEHFKEECKGKKVFLFGAGGSIRFFISRYGNEIALEGVVDNDKVKQGYCLGDFRVEAVDTTFEKIVVSEPSLLNKIDCDETVILINSTRYYKQIIEQLQGMRITNWYVQFFMEEARKRGNNYSPEVLVDAQTQMEYAQLCCNNKVNFRKIVFYSFGTYSDHGKYITEALWRIRKDLDIVWLVNNMVTEVPVGVRKVYMGNWKRYIYEMETARVWIYNMVVPDYLVKRSEQIYIQTKHWAGITLKKFYLDSSTIQDIPEKVENWKYNSAIMDYIITGSEFDTESSRRGFGFRKDVIQVGSPRSDALFDSGMREKVCKYFHVDKEIKIVLYAPTYRFVKTEKAYGHETREIDLDFKKLKKILEMHFGGEWYIMLRLHPSVAKDSAKIKKSTYVIDASSYEDSEELVAACDIMISDYSSIMFEPAFVKKPVFLFATDRKEYIDKEYDFLIDYDTLPFPIAENNEELVQNIANFNQLEYEKNVDIFLEGYGVHEDGHASERAAEYILKLIDE